MLFEIAKYMTAISSVALGLGLACWLRKAAPRFTAWCAFVVGWGIAGWLGVAVASTIDTATLAVNEVGRAVTGLAVGFSFAAFLALWFFFDVRKKGKVSKVAPLVGLVLPSALPLIAAALMAMPATRPVGDQLSALLASVR
jgi:hypothetical protein